MVNKDLIEKIKELKGIKPSQEWLDSTRHNLVTEIDSNQITNSKSVNILNWLRQPQSVVLALCLLLIFIAGPWLTLEASQSSLPGELLYSVKKASEGIQATVTSKENKTQLQMEFAGRRLEELAKLSNDFSPEEEVIKAKKVISGFEGNLANISQYVKEISKEEVVAIAEKTVKLKQDLDKTKEQAPLEIQADLAEAEKAVEKINRQILAVLMGNEERNEENNASTTPDQEILIFLQETEDGVMTTTEQIINIIEQ